MNYTSHLRPGSTGPVGRRAGMIGLLVVLGLALTGCGMLGIGDRDPPPPTSTRTRYPPPSTVRTEPPPSTATVPIAAPPAEVVVAAPPRAEATPSAPPGRPVPVPAPADPANPAVEDRFGFDGDRYLSLLTPEEMDVLRLRARGDVASHLSRFLTDKERENLRRRAAELTEIGAEPLRVGE